MGDSTVLVTLPDGRRLDIGTADGAASYLAFCPAFVTVNAAAVLDEAGNHTMRLGTILGWAVIPKNLPAATLAAVAEAEKQKLVEIAALWCAPLPQPPPT